MVTGGRGDQQVVAYERGPSTHGLRTDSPSFGRFWDVEWQDVQSLQELQFAGKLSSPAVVSSDEQFGRRHSWCRQPLG
jgi:hypothetical protein